MIKRKVYNIDEVDVSIPPGGIVSISPYCSHPFPANKLEMLAMGIFIENYIPGKPVPIRYGYPRNHEDVRFRTSYGDLVTIYREDAEDPEVSYAVVPYRVASSSARTAFAKNFIIVDKSLSTIDYLSVPSIDVGADAQFIPIRAESLIDNDLLFAINSL
ncbi:MAG: hypothetical protein HXO60_07055 [Rothia mucilaginosa]|uniref:hypothetical protein n=1 Tax=Rothia mucilaginosa TaxID=43675 RepID=UPI001CAA94E7|nr:hypothetical protein [Rothia mucilaginosa]MBF1652242.1 hypothetical protein [Rothia mucilaginosa]